jgi:hypothetical protein
VLTVDDVRWRATLRLQVHMKLTRGGVFFQYGCAEWPRLQKTVERTRRDRPPVHTFFVDGWPCADFAEAVARLNGPEREPPSRGELRQLLMKPSAPRRVYTARECLAELERELRYRARVYPGLKNATADSVRVQIEILEQIRDRYRDEAAGEPERPKAPLQELAPSLFEATP